MGKRYYCDYCDRSFIDDLEARKKHLNGSMHMRLKKEHYYSFRDSKTLLAEETAKKPCKRFLRNGECVFGSNCRFTHFSHQELQDLEHQIQEAERQKEMKMVENSIPAGDSSSILASWLQKRSQRQPTAHLKPEGKQLWELPPGLRDRPDLPPSLRPVTAKSFTSSDFEDWG
ncbi:zinc finger matrin-type protein 5-like [Zootermopsis nevadensis]|uniref:Zinc finger matrin-type protein 5 n=1 Tax=Zootermopsis nevadensis TaxID=136037 RepID=A0A067QTV5_ZOONE|nr:zinc finger matrin-type protein 5-like [Zootermopsis nevadensis]KDR07385.1 Zinc finger matrin-type protein 5 [Zootermopsis nevadensis]